MSKMDTKIEASEPVTETVGPLGVTVLEPTPVPNVSNYRAVFYICNCTPGRPDAMTGRIAWDRREEGVSHAIRSIIWRE